MQKPKLTYIEKLSKKRVANMRGQVNLLEIK